MQFGGRVYGACYIFSKIDGCVQLGLWSQHLVPGWDDLDSKETRWMSKLGSERRKMVIGSMGYSYERPMAKLFQLFGITYLMEKIKFKLLFQGPLAK